MKARIETTRATTVKRSENINEINPINPPIFSLIALSIIGRSTEAKIPRIGPIKTVDNPSHIAHHAVRVFGFSLNLLIISFSIFIFYHFDANFIHHNLNILLNFISY